MKVLMVVAPTMFRDIEYIVSRAFFEQAGCEVRVASVCSKLEGKFGYRVKADCLFGGVQWREFNGVFFVGGVGVLEFESVALAKQLALDAVEGNLVLGAICAAPRLFLKWGLMKEREVTGHNWDGEFENLAIESGALPILTKDVVISNNIVTGNGPEATEACAKAFLDLL